jgi:adenosylhomocysteine nucleosidase
MTGGWGCPWAEPSVARPGRVPFDFAQDRLRPVPTQAMSTSAKVAMIAALEREVRPLVKGWRRVEREYEGWRFTFFESGQTVLVCGGIGAEAARRAAEAVIVLYRPELVQSVGFAGALDPALKVGEIFAPSRVVDAKDGSSNETGTGFGVLISAVAVAGVEEKARLAEAYSAQAVDMEAAAVARAAQARGVRFMAVKAISDENNFVMPSLDRFVGGNGQFRTGRFVALTALRPWLWPRVIQLARNGAKASRALCAELERSINDPGKAKLLGAELHPISKVTN